MEYTVFQKIFHVQSLYNFPKYCANFKRSKYSPCKVVVQVMPA